MFNIGSLSTVFPFIPGQLPVAAYQAQQHIIQSHITDCAIFYVLNEIPQPQGASRDWLSIALTSVQKIGSVTLIHIQLKINSDSRQYILSSQNNFTAKQDGVVVASLSVTDYKQLPAYQGSIKINPCCLHIYMEPAKLHIKHGQLQLKQSSQYIYTTTDIHSGDTLMIDGYNTTLQLVGDTITINAGAGFGLGRHSATVFGEAAQYVPALQSINGIKGDIQLEALGALKISVQNKNDTINVVVRREAAQ